MNNNISATLKDLRLSANLTQKELADKLNIGQSTIVGYEKGRNEPVISILIAYANFFGISIDELIGYDITEEEHAAGARATVRKNLTPIEDEMLYAFRQVGKKLGEKGQLTLIEVAEGMAGIK